MDAFDEVEGDAELLDGVHDVDAGVEESLLRAVHLPSGRIFVPERPTSCAAEYLDRRAKLSKRSASAVLSELVAEAARQDARERALKELGEGVEIPEREVQRWALLVSLVGGYVAARGSSALTRMAGALHGSSSGV